MITKKDWKDFQEYRGEKEKERYLSKEWVALKREFMKAMSPKTIKHKFLWWKWEEIRLPDFLELRYALSIYETRKKSLEIEYLIPEETIEECLNWLISKKIK